MIISCDGMDDITYRDRKYIRFIINILDKTYYDYLEFYPKDICPVRSYNISDWERRELMIAFSGYGYTPLTPLFQPDQLCLINGINHNFKWYVCFKGIFMYPETDVDEMYNKEYYKNIFDKYINNK